MSTGRSSTTTEANGHRVEREMHRFFFDLNQIYNEMDSESKSAKIYIYPCIFNYLKTQGDLHTALDFNNGLLLFMKYLTDYLR